MDRISAMTIFVRVVETGSFSTVARQMNTTQPTISKNIAELETWLGVKLLNRSTRSLHLTEAGTDYYERCVSILQDIEEAEQNVGQLQTQPKGVVRVNTVVAFGRLHVVPLLKEFFALYPAIKVEILLNDRTVDLVEEGLDLAIRMGNLTDSSLIAKKLTCSPMVTVATPEYLALNGTPIHPRDLKNHNCVIYTGLQKTHELHYQENGESIVVRVEGNFLSNNSEAMREALLAGYGITKVPKWLVGDALADGRLVAVLNDFSHDRIDIFAVYPPGRHLALKARHFIDFFNEKLSLCDSIVTST